VNTARTVRFRLAAVAVATLLVLGFTPSLASAGEVAPTLTGEQACNGGNAVVTWTLTNGFPVDLPISSATMSIDGGAPTDLDFSPNPLPADGESTAQATVPAISASTATAVAVVESQGPLEVEGELDIDPCPQPLDPTTTTTLTTTTTPAPAAVAIVRQPAFTG
jgi:hypothetical protein